MKLANSDTIAAIATPIGEGAVSVIRLSGQDAFAIGDRVFQGKSSLIDAEGNTVHHGYLVDSSHVTVDEVLAMVFRCPKSYTGEDVVEFSCHGGVFVTHKVLDLLLDAGARQAEPGEFTKRAFLNGKLDLSQAEAVADVIAARSGRAHAVSVAQLEGKLGMRVKSLRTQLVDLCALLELELDFSEEGLTLAGRDEIRQKIASLAGEVRIMEESFSIGRVFKEGVSVALAGEPNAGKSSLFNALLRENRAIVTPIPGTTRDSLHEEIVIDGILFSLTDTAGLRDTDDAIEREGVSRSRSIIKSSDVIIVVVDATATTDRSIALAHFSDLHPAQTLIVAFNKIDKLGTNAGLGAEFNFEKVRGIELKISAKTGDGLHDLRKWLARCVQHGSGASDDTLYLTNQRHRNAVSKARDSLSLALSSLTRGESNELIAFDIREASDSLATITGEVTSEEVLNHIFSRFCVGK